MRRAFLCTYFSGKATLHKKMKITMTFLHGFMAYLCQKYAIKHLFGVKFNILRLMFHVKHPIFLKIPESVSCETIFTVKIGVCRDKNGSKLPFFEKFR